MTDDTLIFADEISSKEPELEQEILDSWKVIIVDDDKDVHEVTKLVLDDFTFDNKGLNFLSAYTEKEATKLIKDNPDTAVILLDVVMEENDTGLKIAKYIREVLRNSLVRIVLRTGQPGSAPESKVIIDYDINDYKEKTELTSQKLFTTMVTSLRSYRDISTIDTNKKSLEKIILASSAIFELQSLKKFAKEVLAQLISILGTNMSKGNPKSGFSASKIGDIFVILAATGRFKGDLNKTIDSVVSPNILECIRSSIQMKKNVCCENSFIGYFESKSATQNVVFIDGIRNLSELDRYIIETFFTNVSIAIDNIYLNKEIETTQREIIYTLGEVAEARSKETSNHVKRVAEYSKILALKYGLLEDEAELIRTASPMHDVGKLGIPDAILNKPGNLTKEEFEIIKTHSLIGYDMLKNSSRSIMKSAAIIALQHHEKYDGTGYPQGLKGNQIHIYGRITAVADVFDALGSDRVYKKAWELDRILNLFKEEKGTHFDPALIDIFFDNLDEFIRIRDMFRD